MAKYQVKSKEELQQNVVNGDKSTVVYFSHPTSAPKLDAAIASAEEDEIDLAIVDIIKYIKNQKIEWDLASIYGQHVIIYIVYDDFSTILDYIWKLFFSKWGLTV